MTGTVASVLRALWLALHGHVRLALLCYELWELEHWMRDCQRDGLRDSAHLRGCNARAAELRVQIVLAGGALRPLVRRIEC